MQEEHRIMFSSNPRSIDVDKSIFTGWENGTYTTKKARVLLQKSIGYEISDETFLINAAWLGYRRKD